MKISKPKKEIIRAIDVLRKDPRLRKQVEQEVLFIARKFCKESRGSTVRSWHGKNIEIIRNEIKLIFPELSGLTISDSWSLINNIKQLTRKKDRVIFDKCMKSQDMLIESIAQVLLTHLPSSIEKSVEWKGVPVHQFLKTSNDVKTFCARSNIRKEKLKHHLLENRTELAGIHVERDADQKNVQDFTIWVRFEETRQIRNWKESKIKEAVESVIGKVKPSAKSKSEFQRGLANSMVSREKFPLRDPTTLSRIKVPGKGIRCEHPQCFDVEVYIGAKLFQRDVVIKTKDRGTKKLERWACPICNKLTEVKDLFIDEFWKEIIADPKTHEVDSIIVFPDCTFQIEELHGEASESDSEGPMSSKPTKQKSDVIDLISDDEDTQPPPPRSKSNLEKKIALKPTSQKSKAVQSEIIDLRSETNQSAAKKTTISSENKRKRVENLESRKRRKTTASEIRKKPVVEKKKMVVEEQSKSLQVRNDTETDAQFLRTFLAAIHLQQYEKIFKEKNLGFRELIKIYHSQSHSDTLREFFGKNLRHYAIFLRFSNLIFSDPDLLKNVIVGETKLW